MSDTRFTDLVIKDFRLGLNRYDDTTLLQPNELSSAKNVVTLPIGALSNRLGFKKLTASALVAASPINAMIQFVRDAGTQTIIAVCGTKVWTVSMSAGTAVDTGLGTSSNFTLASGASHVLVQYQDRVYGTSWKGATSAGMFVIAENVGSVTTLKSWIAGVHPPTNALTYTDDTGTLSGVFKYTYAYGYGEDAGHGQSNSCATALTTSSLTLKKVILTIFGTSKDYLDWDAAHDAGIDKVYIYRTEAGGTDYYLHATVTSGVTYEDNTATDDTTVVPQTDNYPLAAGAAMCVHQGRLVVANTLEGGVLHPRRVWWSLPGYPDIRPAQNYADMPADLGAVGAVAELNGTLYVFQDSGVSVLNIIGAADYTTSVVQRVRGPAAQRCLSTGIDAGVPCVFYAAPGPASYHFDIYRFDGTSVQIISDRDNDVALATATPATAWDGRYFRVSAMIAASTNEHWYDTATSAQTPRNYSAGTWWPQSLKSGSIYAYSYAVPRQSILYWGDSNGFIYYDYTASTDDTAEILGDAYTGYWDCGDPGWEKRIAKILVDAKVSGTVTVAWDTDFNAQAGFFVLTPSSTTGRTEYEVPGIVDFRRIRLRIYGTGGNSFSLAAITLRVGRRRPD